MPAASKRGGSGAHLDAVGDREILSFGYPNLSQSPICPAHALTLTLALARVAPQNQKYTPAQTPRLQSTTTG